jgi:hypothetical protein
MGNARYDDWELTQRLRKKFMAERTGIFGKFLALVQGEVPADALEAYRRGGQAVYDLLQQVENRRLELKIEGLNPWTVDPATQAQFLCAWNAFVLQTLGDQFLEADYQGNPATTGYVPPMTAEQSLAFYSQVGSWLSRARQAQNNPAYRLDVRLPAYLPPWGDDKPCPTTHLDGMVAATRLLRTHAEAAIAVFESETIPPDKQTAIHQIRQLLAAATSEAEYAEQLWAPNLPQEVHEQVEERAKNALECYYHLGQILAMPQLLDRTQPSKTQSTALPTRRLLPGDADFDPWCLTDPAIRDKWQCSPEAREAISTLWESDPDPQQTLAIQAEIDTALALGDIVYATDQWGTRLGHYYCCPWAPIYALKRPVAIARQQMYPGQEFTFDVSAMAAIDGGTFKRQILVKSFQPTSESCLPRPRTRHRHSRHRGC